MGARGAGTLSSIIVRNVVAMIDACGADGRAAAERVGIPAGQLDDPKARFGAHEVGALVRAAPSLTGDDAFALHAAERSGPGAFGLIEYFVRTSPTLRVGLERFAAHYRVACAAGHVTFEEDDGGHLVLRGRLNRQAAEYFAVAVVTIVRRAIGMHDVALAVAFRHEEPADTREHARIFAAPVTFGAPVTRVSFSAAILARPLLGADDILASLLLPLVEEAHRAVPSSDDDIVERTRIATRETLTDSRGSLRAVARELATSPRSLQRALAAHGTSFQAILDDVRRELALAYVADESRAFEEIAALVGFSQPSAFYRAFKRWTDLTPKAWRERGHCAA